MGRAKLNMELIKNEKARVSTYQKRKDGLKKKTKELAILCGVKACIILARPPLPGQPPEVDTWPEDNPAAIKDLIKNYKQQSPEDHRKRTLTLANFLEDKKKKAENSLMKLRKGNYELKYPTWDEQYNGLLEEQLRGFGSVLEGKIEVVKARIELLKGSQRMEMLCQNYVVENENSNNSGAQFCSGQNGPYMMPTLVRRRSMEFDFIHPQGTSWLNSNDPFDQTQQQGLHLDQNSMMMMLTNNNNYTQLGISASSSNMLYAPLTKPPVYYDPVSIKVDSMVVNNPMMPAPVCYYGPAVQSIPPYLQFPMNIGTSSQIHASQVEEYFQADDFEMKKLQ